MMSLVQPYLVRDQKRRIDCNWDSFAFNDKFGLRQWDVFAPNEPVTPTLEVPWCDPIGSEFALTVVLLKTEADKYGTKSFIHAPAESLVGVCVSLDRSGFVRGVSQPAQWIDGWLLCFRMSFSRRLYWLRATTVEGQRRVHVRRSTHGPHALATLS